MTSFAIMLPFVVILGLFVLLYVMIYAFVMQDGCVYSDIDDCYETVKIIKKGFFKTTIAYVDREPMTIATIEFMLRYTVLIGHN